MLAQVSPGVTHNLLTQVSPGAAHNSLTQDSPIDHIFSSLRKWARALDGVLRTPYPQTLGQRPARNADGIFSKAVFLTPCRFCRRQFLGVFEKPCFENRAEFAGTDFGGVQVWAELKRPDFENRQNCTLPILGDCKNCL